MKNKETTPSKNHNNFPVVDPKDMEIYNLPNKDFEIAVLRKLNELQENKENSTKSGKQYTHTHKKK